MASEMTVEQLVARIKQWCETEDDDQPIEFICETILPALERLLVSPAEQRVRDLEACLAVLAEAGTGYSQAVMDGLVKERTGLQRQVRDLEAELETAEEALSRTMTMLSDLTAEHEQTDLNVIENTRLLTAERDALQRQVSTQNDLIADAMEERDTARTERDALRLRVEQATQALGDVYVNAQALHDAVLYVWGDIENCEDCADISDSGNDRTCCLHGNDEIARQLMGQPFTAANEDQPFPRTSPVAELVRSVEAILRGATRLATGGTVGVRNEHRP